MRSGVVKTERVIMIIYEGIARAYTLYEVASVQFPHFVRYFPAIFTSRHSLHTAELFFFRTKANEQQIRFQVVRQCNRGFSDGKNVRSRVS